MRLLIQLRGTEEAEKFCRSSCKILWDRVLGGHGKKRLFGGPKYALPNHLVPQEEEMRPCAIFAKQVQEDVDLSKGYRCEMEGALGGNS